MAPDTRIFCIHISLFMVTFFPQFIENTNVKVSLDWNDSKTLPPHFLSMSIDPNTVVDGKTRGFKEGFDAIKAMSMAAALSPGYLLMGGPSTDHSCFHFETIAFLEESDPSPKELNNKTACCDQRPNKMIITGEQLTLLSHFAEEVGLKIALSLGYDYNLHQQKLRSDSKDVVNCDAWDVNETLKLMHFTNTMNISMNYQLGYEMNYSFQTKTDDAEEKEKFVKNAEKCGKAFAHDLNHLRDLLDKYPSSQKSIILSPGIRMPGRASSYETHSSQNFDSKDSHVNPIYSAYLQAYLKESSRNLDAIVWHTSAFIDEKGHSAARYSPSHFLNEENNIYNLIGKSAPHKPIWIGESYTEVITQPASYYEDFNIALKWAEHLGTASKIGSQVVFHSLKDIGDNSPNPKYWVSLLQKYLAGSVVAQTDVSSMDDTDQNIQFFAHCTPHSVGISYIDKFPKGSVTLYAANPTNNSINVFLQVANHDPNDESTEAEIYEYALTSEEEGGIPTGKTKLNGIVLEMGLNGEMPHLHPNLRTHKRLRSRRSAEFSSQSERMAQVYKEKYDRSKRHAEDSNQIELFMQPKSITFWVFKPNVIGHTPCMEKEEDIEKKIEQFQSYSHHSSSTQMKDLEDSKKQVDDGIKHRRKRQNNKASYAEISKRRLQARKIRPFSNISKRAPIKGLETDVKQFEDEYSSLGASQRNKRKTKGSIPKVVSFHVEEEEDEAEPEDGYAKGMLTLSEVIAMSSKEEGDFDDDFSDETEKKFGAGVFKGIWNLGKKLGAKPRLGIDSRDRLYNGPSAHIMGIGRKPKTEPKTSVIKEPMRELFEAEIKGWDDEVNDAKDNSFNGLTKEDQELEESDEYLDSDEDQEPVKSKVMKDTENDRTAKKATGNRTNVDKYLLESEEIDSQESSFYNDEDDERESSDIRFQELGTSNKNSYGHNMDWTTWEMPKAEPLPSPKMEDTQYFRRYKRKTGERLLQKRNLKQNKGSGGLPATGISIEGTSRRTRKLLEVTSEKYPSKTFLGRETDQINDIISNDISENFESQGEMPKLERKTYNWKNGALDADGNDGMLTGSENDDTNRSVRQSHAIGKLKLLNRKQSSLAPSIRRTNADPISKQLSSPNSETEGEEILTDNSNIPMTIPKDNPQITTYYQMTPHHEMAPHHQMMPQHQMPPNHQVTPNHQMTPHQQMTPHHEMTPNHQMIPYHSEDIPGTYPWMENVTTASPTPSTKSRADAARAEQRRISMEAMRRRTIEERRKALKEYREMLQERRQKMKTNPTQAQILGTFKRGMERMIQEIWQGNVEKSLNLSSVREKRQLLMYDDSKGADHHRVIRKRKWERRNGRLVKATSPPVTSDLVQEVEDWNPDEIWPIDKEFSSIADGKCGSEKFSADTGKMWRQKLQDTPKQPLYYSIDTDKAYEPGLYDVINSMLESIPPSELNIDLIDINKSRLMQEKYEKMHNARADGQKGNEKESEELDEEKYEGSKKKNSYLKIPISRGLKKKRIQSSLEERIQKAKEERLKVLKSLEKKSRVARSVNYDLNRVSDDDNLLANKMAKHRKTLSDKARLLFYMLDENNVRPKKENELHLKKIIGVERLAPIPKKNVRNDADKRKTVDVKKKVPAKDDPVKKIMDYVAMKEKETEKKIDDSIKKVLPKERKGVRSPVVLAKKANAYKGDDTFFSQVLQHVFDFMDSLHNVMSTPFGSGRY